MQIIMVSPKKRTEIPRPDQLKEVSMVCNNGHVDYFIESPKQKISYVAGKSAKQKTSRGQPQRKDETLAFLVISMF